MWERLETEFEKGLPRHEEIQELQQRSRGMLRHLAAADHRCLQQSAPTQTHASARNCGSWRPSIAGREAMEERALPSSNSGGARGDAI